MSICEASSHSSALSLSVTVRLSDGCHDEEKENLSFVMIHICLIIIKYLC